LYYRLGLAVDWVELVMRNGEEEGEGALMGERNVYIEGIRSRFWGRSKDGRFGRCMERLGRGGGNQGETKCLWNVRGRGSPDITLPAFKPLKDGSHHNAGPGCQ
jgi:hypothetical protein